MVAHPIKRSDIPNYNKRRQALAWLRLSETKYRLVQSGFAALGSLSLETACANDDGFALTREPNAEEIERIHLLESLSKILLADFFGEVEVPACKIIKHDAASWQGMANCIPLKKTIRVSSQVQIRYRLSHIALKGSLLMEDEFGVVLSTYLHEIAHMFGAEGSASFSRALTELLELTLRNTKLIEHYREQWYALASRK